MTLAEIAQGYRESELAVSARREELRARLAECTDPVERMPLETRIACLGATLRELRKIRELCERYYEKGYWRDEKYTFNPPRSGNPGRGRAVAKVAGRGKRGEHGPAAKESGVGHSGGVDAQAAGDLADVFIRKFVTGSDRKKTWRG